MDIVITFIERIAQDPRVNIVSLLVGILGVVLAYVFYRKSMHRRTPKYAIRNTPLVRNLKSRLSKLEVIYDNEKIEDITISRIAFWNAGSDTISRDDIAQADPVRVTLQDDAKLLDLQVLKTKKDANQFNARLDAANRILLEFDYLDENDGAIIQLVHTGTRTDSVRIEGTVKGAKGLISVDEPSLEKSKERLRVLWMRPSFLIEHFEALGTLIYFLGALASFWVFVQSPSSWWFLILAIILCLATLIFYTEYMNSRLPEGFEITERTI